MQAVFLTFPLLLHSRLLLISPYGLYVWVTAHVLHSAPHVSCTSPPSPRWNRMVKESIFQSYWRPLIKNVEICNHMEACKLYKPLTVCGKHLKVCNVNIYCLMNIAWMWEVNGVSFNYHLNEKARCSFWHFSNDHVCWIIYIRILHAVTYWWFKFGCESWTESRSRSVI